MKKNLIYFPLTLICLLFLCFCHMANRPAEPIAQSTVSEIPPDHIPPSSTATPSLALNAAGACLMDASSGRVLYGKKENEALPMASTTKIMTCILALENGNLKDTVTFSEKATSMPKVHLGAGKGKSFLLQDLLYSLMLESHNDTAVAIAEHIGGSVEGFAAMMNAKAAELEMHQTNFVTPNGLDAEGHQSTPADMCRLAIYACQNETFLHIISTPSVTIRDTDSQTCYSLTNHDTFLTSYDGALGIKTGFTGKAGYCFVGAARRENRTLVSCVLASGWPPNKTYKWTDTKTLMNYGFQNFNWKTPTIKDLSSYKIRITEGKSSSVGVFTPDISSILLGTSDTVDIEYSIPGEVSAPVKTDIAIGEITISVNGSPLAVYPLYPEKDVEKETFRDLFSQIFELFLSF